MMYRSRRPGHGHRPTGQRGCVVQRIPEPAIERLRELGGLFVYDRDDRPISRPELIAAVADCTYIFALGGIPIDGEILDAARMCDVIGVMEILPRGVDLGAATERSIPVTGLPNLPIISEGTAEFAVALMLSLGRRILVGERSVQHGRWFQYQSMAPLGTLLSGSTLGIVGLGSVGRRIAARARALSMDTLYADTRRLPIDEEQHLQVRHCSLEQLMSSADFVILTPTLTEKTRGLIDRHALALMKRTGYLINVSRGAVVVEEDLIQTLEDGRIAGAALDVHWVEPPVPGGGPNPRLLELENVLLTPHLGTATIEARTEMANHVVNDIVSVLEGRRPSRLLNPEIYGEPPLPQERLA